MLEFKLQKEIESTVPARIGFNYEELKAELQERLEHYNQLIVTEDGIKEAKADRAKLNALKTAINDKRKEIKKEYNKPLALFEDQVKELTGLIDRPIGAIDAQLDEFEQRRIEEKREACLDLYCATFTDGLEQMFTFEKIMNPKWMNKTTTMATIKQEMETLRNRIKADELILNTIEEPWTQPARNIYMQSLKIEEALEWTARQKKLAEERQQAEEARRQAAEARAEAEKAQTPATIQPEQKPAVKTANEAQEMPKKMHTLRLEFQLTMEQAVKLREFINREKISYIKI